MNIFDNPFYKLGVSTRSNRRQISAITEEKIFLNESDSKNINEARNVLIMPQKRLAAEIRWFPGVSDENIREIINYFDRLNAGQFRNKINISTFGNAALLNFAVYSFKFHEFKDSDELIQDVFAVIEHFEAVNPETLCAIINQDRKESGFIPVEIQELEREIHNYRIDIAKTLDSKLSNISRESYLKLVKKLADIYSPRDSSFIISDLLDDYELNITSELEELREIILDSAANFNLEQISSALEQWHKLSRPLALYELKRKIGNNRIYQYNREILIAVREIALNPENKYNRSNEAMNLLILLKKYIAGIYTEFLEAINRDIYAVKVVIKIKEDDARLEEIKREKARREAERLEKLAQEKAKREQEKQEAAIRRKKI